MLVANYLLCCVYRMMFRNEWKRRYGQTLVGVTTTSLYGSYSQYNNLKYWNKRGKTTGTLVYEPTRETIYEVRKWMHKRDPVKYWEMWKAKNDKGSKYKRDHKFRSLLYAYSQLGIKNTQSFHQRGIYFSHLYEKHTRVFATGNYRGQTSKKI